MIAYKFLKPDGSSFFTGFKWELPTGRPGPGVESAIEPCRSGIHACRPEHLPLWPRGPGPAATRAADDR